MKGRISKRGIEFLREGKFRDMVVSVHKRNNKFMSNGKRYKYKTIR